MPGQNVYTDPISASLLAGTSQRALDRSAAAAQEAIRGHTLRDVAKTEQRGLTQREVLRGQFQLETKRRDAELQKYLAGMDGDLRRELQQAQLDLQRHIHSGELEYAQEALEKWDTLWERFMGLKETIVGLQAKLAERLAQNDADFLRRIEDEWARMRDKAEAEAQAEAQGQKVAETEMDLPSPTGEPPAAVEDVDVNLYGAQAAFEDVTGIPLNAWTYAQPLVTLFRAGHLSRADVDIILALRQGNELTKEQEQKARGTLNKYRRYLAALKKKAPNARALVKSVPDESTWDKIKRLWLPDFGAPQTMEDWWKDKLRTPEGKKEVYNGIHQMLLRIEEQLRWIDTLDASGKYPGGSPSANRAAGNVARIVSDARSLNLDPGDALDAGLQDFLGGEAAGGSRNAITLSELLNIPVPGSTAEALADFDLTL